MGDVVNIKQKVESRVDEEKEKHSNGGDGGDLDPKFVQQCLQENELGDGKLFKKLNRGRFVFNKAMDCWMVWAGHHWNIDILNQAAAAVEGVAAVYQQEVKRISKEMRELDEEDPNIKRLEAIRKQLNRRISDLRSNRRRQNCLAWAHTSVDPLAIKGDEVDAKPWKIPCKNGVINLETGELEDGKPEDYLLKSSTVEWQGINAPCPTWDQTLMEVFSENENLVNFLQCVFGYALVGEVIESVLVVMSGRGRNGKSMIVNTVSEILGQLSGAIRPEMLLDQYRMTSSAGPTPDIMALRGIRTAFASETDDGCRISPSRVKWLTGDDTITGRNPHDKHEVHFRPSHTLFLLTNHKPHAPADDFAFWERMVLIPFELSFVNREPQEPNEIEADRHLPDKLKKELPGILAWMVRGCLVWQSEGGLHPPPAVKEAVKEYKRDEDIIQDFIDECCIVDPETHVGATAVYEVFEAWWKKNVSNRVPKQKRFGSLFGKRFEKRKEGSVKYFGVGLLDDLSDVYD